MSQNKSGESTERKLRKKMMENKEVETAHNTIMNVEILWSYYDLICSQLYVLSE